MIDARTGRSPTTGSAEAAERYQRAVDHILGSETGAAEALDQALALDGDFALALAARYSVGGSRVERMLIDLLEDRALDLAA